MNDTLEMPKTLVKTKSHVKTEPHIRFILLVVALRRRYQQRYLMMRYETRVIDDCIHLETFSKAIAHKDRATIIRFYNRNFIRITRIMPNSECIFFETIYKNAFKLYLNSVN